MFRIPYGFIYSLYAPFSTSVFFARASFFDRARRRFFCPRANNETLAQPGRQTCGSNYRILWLSYSMLLFVLLIRAFLEGDGLFWIGVMGNDLVGNLSIHMVRLLTVDDKRSGVMSKSWNR